MDPSLPLESEDGLLRFTPTEATIFGRLLVTAGRTKSQLRVAGGWVRDKLLGIDSKDLDVAVNNMSGLEFARALATDMRVSVSVVRANPAQSKHLETAIVSIEGLHVDFVNLRAEEYTDASRIPVMRPALPEEDAGRRDLTINALFFNLHTRRVEDFTSKGLGDLREGIIRTPAEPVMTLLDDPLRALRCVRFSSRLGFSMASELKEALRCAEVREALAAKVSRERVGGELMGMLSSARPEQALLTLAEAGLLDTVLMVRRLLAHGGVPEETWELGAAYVSGVSKLLPPPPPPVSTGIRAAHGKAEAAAAPPEPALPFAVLPQSEREMIALAAVLLPARHAEFFITTHTAPHRAAEFVVLHSLKLPKKRADCVDTMLTHVDSVMHLLTTDAPLADWGMVLCAAKEAWRPTVLLALTHLHGLHHPSTPQDEVVAALVRYQDVERKLEAAGLARAWEVRPLVNGHTVSQKLGMKPNPRVRHVLQAALHWQFSHPEGDEEGCLAYLREFMERKWGDAAAGSR